MGRAVVGSSRGVVGKVSAVALYVCRWVRVTYQEVYDEGEPTCNLLRQ